MANKRWKTAVEQVLKDSNKPLSRTEIAEAIVTKGLRSDVGKTPANSVVSTISKSLNDDGEASPFIRVGRGEYWVKSKMAEQSSAVPSEADDPEEANPLINSFGMYWDRSRVDWSKTNPKLLGVELSGASPIDFGAQIGIYILYDLHRPIYVGRTSADRLSRRLREHHLTSRFRERWNRFSWFGLGGVNDSGKLSSIAISSEPDVLIAGLEAVLIESLETFQNRRRGDGLKAVEYNQTDDPALQNDVLSEQVIRRLLGNKKG